MSDGTPETPAPARGPAGFRPGLALGIGAATLAVVVALGITLVLVLDEPSPGAHSGGGRGSGTPSPRPSSPRTPSPRLPQPETSAQATAECPATRAVTAHDADSLSQALADARPGTTIRLADGVYTGRFTASAPATADAPIFLCGGPGAVIDGGGIKGGYALHLDGADYWRVTGFTVRNGQKGVVADHVQHVIISNLTVEEIGDEAIHLRKFSSDNVVQGNTVRKTGLRRDTFGEGVYIGTAKSNWCTISDCEPDLSDRNIVRGNHISETTAESIDIKEGTSGGVVSGNTFDGSSFSGSFADSWIDVKGNGWLIEGNTGRNSREDGFQTHEVLKGWGSGNTFTGNTAEVNGPGWGFHLVPVNGNKVTCDNRVISAAKGFANVDCG